MDIYLQRLHSEINTATKGMSIEELRAHREGKWCVAEILEHLYYTYTGTIKGMEFCFKADKPQVRKRTIKERLQDFLIFEAGYFPEGRKAPDRTVPRGMAVDEVLRDIGPKIIAMDEAITQCETRFGEGTLILTHPILGPLTCRQWRKLHWMHGRHHLKQIARLRQQN